MVPVMKYAVLLLALIGCGDNARRGGAPDAGAPPDAPGAPPDGAETPDAGDTVAPETAFLDAPPASATTAVATFGFTGSEIDDHFECALDAAPFAACASPITITVGDGSHSFAVRAVDPAGNADATPATYTWSVDTRPSVCGDGTATGAEICDGADLRGATCPGLGHAPGALACAADCRGYDTAACTGPYDPASAGFTGKVCFNGLRYATPNLTLPYVVACTEDAGVFKTALGDPLTWSAMNAGGITNLHGRAIATNPSGPPIYFVADASAAMNGFRSSNQGGTWTAQSIAAGGAPRELFAFAFRPPLQNLAGSWDAASGAIVLHGNPPGLVAHSIGPPPGSAGSVTGTPHAFANGGVADVYVAVYGRTPAGEPATGGIFHACDLTTTGGGTYEARDAGIAAGDRDRVWSITVDPASVTSDQFACGAAIATGFATTYYAALRGGGQIYKTTDAGASWQPRNTGLPAGAEVYDLAVDCFNTTTAALCHDHQVLYAATSAGLYRSANAGASWALDGFEGKAVRAVAIDPQPAVGTAAPRVFVGVDDAVGIYRSR
jgi:hypothetical protein